MRVCFDFLHPAHVHFFKNAIGLLLDRGDEVLITARRKDITIELLDQLGMPYKVISTLGRGRVGLLLELITRDWRLWREGRRFGPDVLTGISGVCAAHAAVALRRPSVVWDDTEHQRHTHRLTYPVATQVQSPSCYRGRLGPKQVLYDGYHELAYLHPSRFQPDGDVLRAAGIDPDDRISVVRLVGWGAMHDVDLQGLNLAAKRKLVETLADGSRVYITSEAPLPEDLEKYRIRLPSLQVHHLLAFADLCVGESATMASETVVLGGGAIYFDPVGRGYTDEQETRYQMCWNFKPNQVDAALTKAAELMSEPDLRGALRPRWEQLLADKIDVTAYQLEVLDGAVAG